MADNPLAFRVRLPGGRDVHAVRRCADRIGFMTACVIYLSEDGEHDWQPKDTPVGCSRCARAAQDGNPIPA
ncbi:hypothetical protein [Streptomyces collinus]|uniref:hypothetical protein n=1 Tax=Streptomyces collinus TaxID=42684 RepID=UPI003638C83D